MKYLLVKSVFLILAFNFINSEELSIELLNELKSDDLKIVGGEIVDIATVPYQASLAYDGQFFCGATIISSKYLLTAAHCTYEFNDKTKLSVRVGSNYSNTGGEVFKIESAIRHPRFRLRTMNYDVAILKLVEEITLESELKEAISLPKSDDVIEEGALTFVSGFGVTLLNSDETNILRGVELPIVSQKVCKRTYWMLTPQMFCAGLPQGRKDSCQGDSGGPLKRQSDGTLIGVVSYGIGCALPKFYGVYTKVSSVRDWIKLQTGI